MDYLTDIYGKMGAELDPSVDYFEIDSRFMALERYLRALRKGKLCDLGCGRGALLKRLRDYHHVSGTDFDAGAVEHCRSEGLDVHQLDLNRASTLPFPNRLFDIIVISEVCEHLLNPRNAIRVAAQHLQHGGTLIVTVPNAIPLFARLPLLFGRSVPWLHYPSLDTERTGHIRFYTIASMSRLLREEGFTQAEVIGVSFRMNGSFFQRLCFWVPRLFGARSRTAATNMDLWLGRRMPGLSPGLLFMFRYLPSGS
jgi:2-polyprenyl-3-methyl-5-hydroxy-6-metoxy-1,4-benzoquinol methylase